MKGHIFTIEARICYRRCCPRGGLFCSHGDFENVELLCRGKNSAARVRDRVRRNKTGLQGKTREAIDFPVRARQDSNLRPADSKSDALSN